MVGGGGEGGGGGTFLESSSSSPTPSPLYASFGAVIRLFFFAPRVFPSRSKRERLITTYPDSNIDKPREETQYLLFLGISETPIWGRFFTQALSIAIYRHHGLSLILLGLCLASWSYESANCGLLMLFLFYQISYLNHSCSHSSRQI